MRMAILAPNWPHFAFGGKVDKETTNQDEAENEEDEDDDVDKENEDDEGETCDDESEDDRCFKDIRSLDATTRTNE